MTKQPNNMSPMTKAEKDVLWRRIQARITRKHFLVSMPSLPSFSLPKWNFRFVLVPTIIVALLGGSASAVLAHADTSKPGDFLFPVDIGFERVKIILSGSGKKEILKLNIAKERFEEGKILLSLVAASHASIASGTTTATTTGATGGSTGATSTSTSTNPLVQKALANLSVTATHLLKISADLEKEGSLASSKAVLAILAELERMAADENIKSLKGMIKNENGSVKVSMKNGKKQDTIHISINEKNNVATSTATSTQKEKYEIKLRDGNRKVEVKIVNGNVQIIEVKKEENGKDRDDDHDDDDDDDKDSNKKKDKKDEPKKVVICHKDGGRAKKTIEVSENALQAHLRHGDTRGKCGDNTATTTPDTTAPTLSNIVITPDRTSATIVWDTNENADSKVVFGTSSPLSSGSASLSLGTLVAHHSLTLNSLTSSTSYTVMIVSKDASGNTATSSERSFTTLSPLDTTAPTVSALGAVLSGTTATVSWTTNEDANGKVWYGTTSPLALSGASFIQYSPLTLSHSFTLSGLLASTTYHYIAVSADPAGNIASSSASFSTP